MKTWIALLLGCTLSVSGLTSCRHMYGNQLDFFYLPPTFTLTEGINDLDSGFGTVFHIDYTKRELSLTYDGEYGYPQPLLSGGTAPRYILEIADGYEGIEDDILNLSIKGNDNAVLYTQGYPIDGKVYGICNVYKDTVGYFSGGGNYGVEEISHSVYYRYDVPMDEFTVLSQLENVMMVAFSDNTLVYWKNRNLYAWNLETEQETFLCKDDSYDSGIQHQSHGSVYFNKDYVLFHFTKAKGATDTYSAYLYTFDTGELVPLRCI